MKNAQIYRFRDKVAVSLPGRETVYLNPLEALELADYVEGCASDVITEPNFSASDFGTRTVTLEE